MAIDNDQCLNTLIFEVLITLRHKKIILKYTNDEYDHFYVFLASESDIRFASSRLDLAVPELWIFVFLLKT